MTNVVRFEPKSANRRRAALEVQGEIKIEATQAGERVTISGAFTDRLQYGAAVLVNVLSMVTQQIIEVGGAGYSSSPPITKLIRRKRRRRPRARAVEPSRL
jgi:hypothetical protein